MYRQQVSHTARDTVFNSQLAVYRDSIITDHYHIERMQGDTLVYIDSVFVNKTNNITTSDTIYIHSVQSDSLTIGSARVQDHSLMSSPGVSYIWLFVVGGVVLVLVIVLIIIILCRKAKN